jgi:hypothetical protein
MFLTYFKIFPTAILVLTPCDTTICKFADAPNVVNYGDNGTAG